MGGRSGGWDHRDQDAFIKVWTQLGCSPFIDCPDSKADFKPSTECNSSYQLKQHEDNSNEYEEYDYADSAEKESHRVDTSRCDSNEESPPSYEDSSNDNLRNNTNEDSGTGVMTLPAGQFSSLLRRLPVAVPGKLQAEFEEHIAW